MGTLALLVMDLDELPSRAKFLITNNVKYVSLYRKICILYNLAISRPV